MEKKKALLTLFGGRSFLPAALLVIHEKSSIVVAISSEQSYKELPQLQKVIERLQIDSDVKSILVTPDGIDAFDVAKIQAACENMVMEYTDTEWIFDITGGTSLMSIAAYEAAKRQTEKSNVTINCWYLNTSQTRIITLVGNKGRESIFEIDVLQYAIAYNREIIQGDLENHRAESEAHWLPFAQKLGKNPRYAEILKLVMIAVGKAKRGRPSKLEIKDYVLKNFPPETYSILEEAKEVGLLDELHPDNAANISFRLSYLQDKFLNGAWLEAYVWNEAKQLGIFHDCQWNQKIVDGDNKNELDVALTYYAQLLIAECKTGEEAFSSETLYQINAVSNMLGNRFVGKLLVTSLPKKHASNDFEAKRKGLSIVLVTAEDLPNIGEILKREALTPTYPRI